MEYRGVLFDFDYTLADSTLAIAEGYRKGMEALGWPPPTEEQVRHTVGMTLEDGYALLTGDHDPERQRAFFSHFQHQVGIKATGAGRKLMIEGTRLFPGTEELLVALKEQGVQVAIVSTKPRQTIQRILVYRELERLVDLVVGGEDVSRAKPDPEGMEFALEKLGLDRTETLFCGDTVIDAATAQGGGLDFCAVLNGTTPATDFANYPHVHIAQDLWGLKQWLEL